MPFDQGTQDNTDLGKALRKAGGAHLSWVATSKGAKEFVQKLFQITEQYELATGKRVRPRNKAQIETFKRCLATWAPALIRHSTNQESRGYLYCLSGQDNLKGTCMTDRGFRSITETWAELGLHEVRKGYQQIGTFEGAEIKMKRWANRYRATDTLLHLAATYGIFPESLKQHFCTDQERFNPIRLRARKTGRGKHETGKIVAFSNTLKVQMLAQDVREYNAYLEDQDIGGIPQPTLRRVFNNGDDTDFDWNKGGRLYAIGPGNYQSLKAVERSKITLNGQPTVELDVRASHLTIVYGLLGAPFDVRKDPYQTPELDRPLAKKIVNAMISKGQPLDKWPRGTKAEYLAETGKPFPKLTGKQASQIVLKYHPCLAELTKAALDWSKIQFIESEVLFAAMRELRDEYDVPTLPVHDSLIVPQENKEVAENVLKHRFFLECGIVPNIQEK
ncbi:hypothetical protein EDD52_102463 [Primorskyibacter sedentarius]|uniref:DNA polymerase family A n=1 Tax=Primorskyibacter sedentarius TaxID=745311 RepID=A0A4R3JNL6_9RHOB|nr:hypothetical protein [Primorskyibacter sedentarius]TCS66645.1 hypothetical protein EDD52_102463 [Primorskyibacter sedentarius]